MDFLVTGQNSCCHIHILWHLVNLKIKPDNILITKLQDPVRLLLKVAATCLYSCSVVSEVTDEVSSTDSTTDEKSRWVFVRWCDSSAVNSNPLRVPDAGFELLVPSQMLICHFEWSWGMVFQHSVEMQFSGDALQGAAQFRRLFYSLPLGMSSFNQFQLLTFPGY